MLLCYVCGNLNGNRSRVKRSTESTLLNEARHAPFFFLPTPLTSVKDCTRPLSNDLKRSVFMIASGKHTSRSCCVSLKWCSIWMPVGRSEEVFCASELWWRIDFSHHLTSNLRRLPIQLVKRVSLTGTVCSEPIKMGHTVWSLACKRKLSRHAQGIDLVVQTPVWPWMSSLQKQPPAARNMGRGSTLNSRAGGGGKKSQTCRLSIRNQGPQSLCYLRMLFTVSLTTQRASHRATHTQFYTPVPCAHALIRRCCSFRSRLGFGVSLKNTLATMLTAGSGIKLQTFKPAHYAEKAGRGRRYGQWRIILQIVTS